MTPTHISADKPLVCRPDKSLWLLVVVFAAVGVLPAAQVWFGARTITPQDDLWAGAALVALFGFPATGTAWYLIHCRIVADARGLTFYGWHSRRFVAWNDITDFELRIPSSSQSKSGLAIAYVQFNEKWRRLSRNYSPYDALLERIALEAKWSRSRVWQQNDLRDDGDWPKIYEYHDASGWKLFGAYFGFTLALFGLIFLKNLTYGVAPMLAGIALTWKFLSPWGRVGFVALPFLVCSLQPMLILAQYPAIVTRRRYLGQKIVASRDGLSLFKNARETAMRWDEITSYHLETLPGHFQPHLCVIESRRERIEFVSGISQTKTLLSLVQNRAVNASTTRWRYQNGADEDVLGGAASFYRGGAVGVGPKIHHYRTRMSRIFLIFGLFMVAAFVFVLHMQSATGRLANGQPVSNADTVTGIFLMTSLGLATLWGLVSFVFSSVWCEADGLRQRSIWGERFVAWQSLEKFECNGIWYAVKGRERTIRYGVFIADASGLRDEIERQSGIKMKNNSQNKLG